MAASLTEQLLRHVGRVIVLGTKAINEALIAVQAVADEHEAVQRASKQSGRRARNPRSAKAKGRAGVVEARAWILRTFGLEEDDLLIQTTSVGGSDIHYSPTAKRTFPFAPEVKNVEGLNIWEALAQAETNAKKRGLKPVLFFRRNKSQLYIAFRAADLPGMAFPQQVTHGDSSKGEGEWEEPKTYSED